jgi:tetratricopeptide (TPR) repeat protein
MNLLFLIGHNDAAEKWFLESIRLNPDQANVYSNLGSLYGMTNRPQQAENMFKQAIAVNPNYVEGYFNLGEKMEDLCVVISVVMHVIDKQTCI